MGQTELSRLFMSRKVPYTKPFYSINFKDEKEVIQWFKDTNYALENYYRPHFQEQKENLHFFLGQGVNPNYASPYVAAFANMSDMWASQTPLFINDVYRVTMASVATVIAHDLIPDVLPNTEDYSDKVACNIVKDWLESLNYDLNTETWRFRWELQKKIFGECFVFPRWNPDKGDLHPLAKEYIKADIDLVDEEGNPITNIGGKNIKIRKDLRIGDLEYVTPLPWDVMIDPQDNFDKSLWNYYKEYVDVEYLKKEFPDKNWDVTIKGNTQYDPNTNTDKHDPNRRCIYYFTHKSCKFIPEGRYVVASDDYVLVNEPLKMPTVINDQDLPIIRFLDMDLGYGVRGIPMFFRNVKNLVVAYNGLSNQMYSNTQMESPKMYVHEQSGVDAQRMPDGTTAIEWKGNIKPTIETPQTNTASISNFREAIKKNIDEMSNQNPMVRGDTPNAQLDSFVALQYFEDLRNLLATPDIKGHMRSMEKLYRWNITIVKDRYKKDDGRLIKILGKHNTYQLKFFDPINLQKSYDVKITSTGNLATSKAARTQMMLVIKRDFPHLINDENFLDILGLSQTKKLTSTLTAAVSSAEAENQEMMGGTPVLPPARFEDLITHWETHRIPMQTLDFKQSPIEVQDLFIDHVAGTEKLMFEQAAENPMFGERLNQLKQFPMFYTPRPVNEVPPGDGIEGRLPPDLPPDINPSLPANPIEEAQADLVA